MYDPSASNDGPSEYSGPFGGDYNPQPSPMDQAKDFIQKNGKSILVVLVVAVVGFFIYDYFVGSLVNTTIRITDTENKTLGVLDARLFEGSSTTPITTFSGTHTASLRPGEYRVEVNAGGSEYADPGTIPFTISSEDKEAGFTQTVEVEKEIDASIESVELPQTFVAGQQNAQGTVTVRFGTQAQPIELVFEDGFATMDITVQPAIISGVSGGVVPVSITFSVPSTIKVGNTKTGDSKTGTVRIKYTNNEKKSPFTLFKTFSLDVNPKTPQSFAVTANKLFTKTFTLRNTSGADSSEAVQAEVTIKSTQENTITEIPTWFTWSPSVPFNALKKGESLPVQMQLMTPPSALSDTITGEIRFFTGFWSQIVPFTLNLTEAKVELRVTIDNSATTKTYSLTKEAAGNYETKNALLRLDNQSALPIENILMDTGGCDDYIKLLDTDFFLNLELAEKGKTGSTKTTTLQITAPLTALPASTQNCLVQISYLDPKTGDVTQNDPINVIVTT